MTLPRRVIRRIGVGSTPIPGGEPSRRRPSRGATPTFTHSFGDGGDPAAFWRRAEEDGEPLTALIHFLNQPFAIRAAGDVTQYLWPRAYSYETWGAVPGEARTELQPIYGAEDFKRFERFGSYSGFRAGITAGGDWIFFVGGD